MIRRRSLARPLALLPLLWLPSLVALLQDHGAPPGGPSGGPGAVVAVGGGRTTEAIVARTLALAGGPGARVLVVPFASSAEDAGEGRVRMWREAGAGEVRLARRGASTETRRALAAADLVWMGGGDQNRLIAALREEGLVEAIQARHRAGAVVGGTSAGAAVLSARMITGEADLERIAPEATELDAGLGVAEGVLVDQHAVRRRRLNRLLSAVLDHPEDVGLAVDERTAAILSGSTVEVVGDGVVCVVDAREARVAPPAEGRPHGALGLRLDVLRSGMSLDLAARRKAR